MLSSLQLNLGCEQATEYEVGPCPDFYMFHIPAVGARCLVKEAGLLSDREGRSFSLSTCGECAPLPVLLMAP